MLKTPLEYALKEFSYLAINFDGRIIVGASDIDESLPRYMMWGFFLWNNRCLQHTIIDLSGGVRSIAINPDGQILASVHENGVVKIWNTSTGQLLVLLLGIAHTLRASPSALMGTGLLAPMGIELLKFGGGRNYNYFIIPVYMLFH